MQPKKGEKKWKEKKHMQKNPKIEIDDIELLNPKIMSSGRHMLLQGQGRRPGKRRRSI